MFITERGSNRFLYLSGATPFEMEIATARDEMVHIYFRNTTEFNESETRQRYGCYKTEEEAKRALQRFMEAFANKERSFVFESCV